LLTIFGFIVEEIEKLNSKIIKIIEEDKIEGDEHILMERPMLCIVSIIPVKDYLSSID